MHNKKSQAAMEFLMTYGWAILIVLIVLAVLFAFGVFNPGPTKNNCSADQPFGCIDIKLNVDGTGQMVIEVGQVSGVPDFVASSFTDQPCTAASWDNFKANSRNIIDLTCGTATAGDAFSGSFQISYTSAVSNVDHTATIKYSGKYE